MIRYLLDVNVLIALVDPDHVRHEIAHNWFNTPGGRAWATCPITENGLLRIVGNRRYPNSPGTPAAVAKAMTLLRAQPGHEFWPDDMTLLNEEYVQRAHLLDPRQVTDTYLLALASSRGGRLATFDRNIVTNTVTDGQTALHLIV